MERDYNKYSHPNWAKFIDGKLDLPTAFWGFLVGGSIVLIAVFALSMLAAMSGKSSIRNLVAGALGVFVSTIGVHLATGVERYDFGVQELTEGIKFVPVLIGLFAMSELLAQSKTLNNAVERMSAKALRLPTFAELKSLKGTILRSSGLGTFIGILPAEGSTVAAMMGYNEAKRFSKTPEKFGTGCAEGIVCLLYTSPSPRDS